MSKTIRPLFINYRLRQARDFHATEFDCTLAQIVNVDLTACAAKDTPKNIRPAMKGGHE